jgi:CheY-like chemotaxis protein
MDAPSGKSPPVVLVVEDDPLLRMLAVEVVEEVGFVALQAGGADEAVALLEARSDISLLFTDIDMPGSMDGLKLAHAVRGRWPQDPACVGEGSASAVGATAEQSLCQKAISGGDNGRGTPFARRFPLVHRVPAAAEVSGLFCSLAGQNSAKVTRRSYTRYRDAGFQTTLRAQSEGSDRTNAQNPGGP